MSLTQTIETRASALPPAEKSVMGACYCVGGTSFPASKRTAPQARSVITAVLGTILDHVNAQRAPRPPGP